MPSTYAHYRMGNEVLELLPQEIKNIIKTHKNLYLIGLHGPDILFYYKPLKSNPVNQIGYNMHKHSGKEFFENACEIIKKNNYRDEYLAYTFGVICHFSLDVKCHGYVDEKILKSDVPHAKIEVEFDRELMIMDGLDPIRHRLTEHIISELETADIIKDFYGNIAKEKIVKALKSMRFYNNVLIAPSKLKRNMVYGLLKISGNIKEMRGLIISYEKDPNCHDSTEKLMLLYNEARKLACKLIIEYKEYLSEKSKLSEIYNYSFGSKLIEKSELNEA